MTVTSKSASHNCKELEFALGAPSTNPCLLATTIVACKWRKLVKERQEGCKDVDRERVEG
jgi:hypothetical protein